MKKKMCVLLFLFSALGLHAQDDILIEIIVGILQTYCMIYEANPYHQDHSTEISNLFSEILANRNTYSPDQRDNARTKTFGILYENTISEYEDSTDVRRMNTRRMVLNMTLALLSPDDYRFYYFLECAKISLPVYTNFFGYDNQYYTLIKLLEIMMLLENTGTNTKYLGSEFDRLKKFIREHDFPNDFFDGLSEIIAIIDN